MQELSVSVALCTCNGAAYVVEQVDSILRQTWPVLEIVVHDDASEDDTVERVERAWTEHQARTEGDVPELRITRNLRRLGVARNFEEALRDCRGDLIALCDQDDRWDSERLAAIVPRFIENPQVLMIHGNATLVDQSGANPGGTLFNALAISEGELRMIEQGRGWEPLLDRNLVTGATAVLRSALRDGSLPIPAHWLHDEWLGMMAALLGGLAVERNPLLAYRQHGANQIGARRAGPIDLVRRALDDRGQWHTDKMYRAIELAERARALGRAVDPSALEAIEEKAVHHSVRAHLPGSRPARLVPVWQEWKTGRYRRFGRGLNGVLRDLLQPDKVRSRAHGTNEQPNE